MQAVFVLFSIHEVSTRQLAPWQKKDWEAENNVERAVLKMNE